MPLTPSKQHIKALRTFRSWRKQPPPGRPRPLQFHRLPSRTETTINSRSAALETISPLPPGNRWDTEPGSTTAAETQICTNLPPQPCRPTATRHPFTASEPLNANRHQSRTSAWQHQPRPTHRAPLPARDAAVPASFAPPIPASFAPPRPAPGPPPARLRPRPRPRPGAGPAPPGPGALGGSYGSSLSVSGSASPVPFLRWKRGVSGKFEGAFGKVWCLWLSP